MAPAEASRPACMAPKAGSAASMASGPKKVTPPKTRKVRRKGLVVIFFFTGPNLKSANAGALP